jgi:hypothetical protein
MQYRFTQTTESNTMADITDRLFEASKTSQAGKDLWKLYCTLADDAEGDELASRFDAYVDDLNPEARALYRALVK